MAIHRKIFTIAHVGWQDHLLYGSMDGSTYSVNHYTNVKALLPVMYEIYAVRGMGLSGKYSIW